MSDAITTSRATCGPVDQRRPVGSFRVENGIPMFDGPDADMLRLRRAAGLLRRIGAPGDCAAMYRARAFPDATAMFDLGCEWIAAQWIPEFDVLDEPWPWLRRSAVDPQRADGIDAEWIVRTLWDGYLSATDEDNGLVWVYDPVPGVMDMDADKAFDALHCKDLLRVKPFPVPEPGDAYLLQARRMVREMVPLLRGRVTDRDQYETMLRLAAKHAGITASAAVWRDRLDVAWRRNVTASELAEAAHLDSVADMGVSLIPDVDPAELRREIENMLPGMRRLLVGPDPMISCTVFLALRWWVRRRADAALNCRMQEFG